MLCVNILLLDIVVAKDSSADLEHSTIHLLCVFANRATPDRRCVKPEEAIISVVLSEAINAELQLLVAAVVGGEFGAGQEAKICRFRLLAHAAHVLRFNRRLVKMGAISASEAVESGENSVEVGLDVLYVVLVGERTIAKDAEE